MPKGRISSSATPTRTSSDGPEVEPIDPDPSKTRNTPGPQLGEGRSLLRVLSIGMMQIVAVTAALMAAGLMLFHLAQGLVWVCAEAWAHIGAIGWAALVPLGIWFILESIKSCAESTESREPAAG